MSSWNALAVSESGRPIPLANEITYQVQSQVALYEGSAKTRYSNGVLQVTSHRLLWIAAQRIEAPNALQLALADVQKMDVDAIRIWSMTASPKVGLTLQNGSYIRLSFRGGGRDPVQKAISSACKKKAWMHVEEEQEKPKKPGESFSTKSAGVGGLIRQQTAKADATDATLQEAFKDIDALMDNAKAMVDLSKRFAARAVADGEQNAEFTEFMMSMGIANPVTKESTGALYHSELARQLSDFLMEVLPTTAGQMLPMAQVYCLYNRARGTALISPEDLHRACLLLDRLTLPVRLREFPSGVRVLQLAKHSDDAVCQRIVKLVTEHGPQTVLQASTELEVSLTLAKEQLHMAEQRELLCRDESFEGVVFHENFFSERA